MSRFAANPKWLIYLPPTMSPSETSKAEGLLEHPAEAFSYYRTSGVSTVVVEQKHMGSRAIVIVCRSNDVARERFGILEDEDGICYTRTGRRFFEDAALERELLATVRNALDRSGFWEQFNTELGMPRLRADAVVRKGAGTGAAAVRVGWNRGTRRVGRGCRGARARGQSRRSTSERCSSDTRSGRTLPSGSRSAYRQLLLAGRVAARYPRRPVSCDGHRGRGAHGQGSRVAHDHDQQLRRSRRRPLDGHAVSASSTWPIPRARRRRRRGGPT